MTLRNAPVIVVGAPRSGTKLLRDLLCRLPGYGTWPCDEINYIWRYGNAGLPHDQLEPQHASDETEDYILRRFERLQRRRDVDRIVEKTCANCLRLDFVDEIVPPETQYVQIVRDGRDAAVSARERWTGSVDLVYALRKMRFIPLMEFFHYAWKQTRSRLHRLVSKESRVESWGPRFPGIDRAVEELSLIQVCGLQWRRCVEEAETALAKLSRERVKTVRYESLVSEPAEELVEIAAFLGEDLSESDAEPWVEHVMESSVGRWREALDKQETESLLEIIEEPLCRYGYLE